MNIFDNCRICLQCITHEPIKMTRSAVRFIENILHLKNLARHFEPANTRQNVCAACFNKLSDFQEFHELCKDSDDFWQEHFRQDKQKLLEKCLEEVEEDKTIDSEAQQQLMDEPNILEKVDNVLEKPTTEETETTGAEIVSSAVVSLDKAVPQNEKAENVISISCVALEDWNEDEDEELVFITHNPEPSSSDNEMLEFEYEFQAEPSSNAEAPTSTIAEAELDTESVMETFDELDYTEPAESGATTPIVFENPTKKNRGRLEEEFSENTFIITNTIDANGKLKKAYQCQYCDKSFDRLCDIESHYNKHSDIKPYVCTVCGRSFRQKNILTTHQALHFGKKVECPECGKKFARRSQLILHFRMHRDEKPFACEFDGCNAAFRQRQHLVDHSFIHTGEKNFRCLVCTKSFHTRKRLQDHMYKVHSAHRYCCNMCSKSFLKPHMLKNHMASSHNVEVSDVAHLKVAVDT